MSDKENKDRYIDIIYKDVKDLVQTARIPFPEIYDSQDDQQNADLMMQDIYDGGGFWLTETRAIPHHRVLEIRLVTKEKTKNKSNYKRRTPRGPSRRDDVRSNSSRTNDAPQNQNS